LSGINLSRSGTFLPDFSLFLTTVVWGLSFTVLKVILGNEVSPIMFVFLRFTLASAFLFPLCRKRLLHIGSEGIKAGLFLGLLLFAGFMTQTLGISHTTASKSAFITGLSSVFVPVFLLMHRRKLPEPPTLAALALAMLGMFLLTGPAGGSFTIGDLLTLLCAVAFGAQIYVMGNVTRKHDALALTMIEMVSTAALAAMILPFEPVRFHLSIPTVMTILFMALVATAGPLTVQTWAQKRTSAARAGLIYCSEPVFAYIFASVLLGEHFNFVQKVGGAVIILAVLSSEVIPLFLEKARIRRA